MRGAPVIAAALLAVGGTTVASAASPRATPLTQTKTWAFAIGDVAPAATLARYDMVIVDGVDTSAAQVAALRRRGVRVLAYISVGTIERNRPWTAAAAPFRLERWEDWDEWYADVANPAYRALVLRSMVRPVLAKGFDGLMLDNVDMVETHRAQTAGMTALVRSISRQVRTGGRVLMVQNGDTYVRTLVPYIDGWNREDVTATYDFDAERYRSVTSSEGRAAIRAIRWMRAHKKLITTTDYTSVAIHPNAIRARLRACVVGARPFVSDIHLRRLDAPVRCLSSR